MSAKKIIFQTPTALQPNRWYDRIFVTERQVEGKVLRELIFGDSESPPESACHPDDPDKIVKEMQLPLFAAYAHLRSEHHRFLALGVGGGIAPMFWYRHFAEAYVDCVELDAAAVEAAKLLGFQESDRVRVVIGDAMEYVKNYSGEPYDLVMWDFDQMNEIVQNELEQILALLSDTGIVFINCWSRNLSEETRLTNLEHLCQEFSIVHEFAPTHYNRVYVGVRDGHVPEVRDEAIRALETTILSTYPYLDDIVTRLSAIDWNISHQGCENKNK